MAPRRPPRRSLLLPLFGVFVVIVGLAGWAWWAGHLELPFLEQEETSLPEGMIRVPASARVIPAYTRITRDDLIDPRTGTLFTVAVDEGVAKEVGLILNLSEIVGRVTDSDKSVGYAFQEKNFVRSGTRAGLVAGIPPGMRGYTVEVDDIEGLHKLMPGDRFDLAEAVTVTVGDFGSVSDRERGAVDTLVSQATAAGLAKQASVRIIVENGLVVTPVERRVKSSTTRGLTSTSSRSVPIEEVTIAVDAKDVARLVQALAIDASVICLPRSGDPEPALEERAPDHVPWSPFDGLNGEPAPSASAEGEGDASDVPHDARPGEGGMRFIERVVGDEIRLVPVPKSRHGGSS